MLKEHSGKSFNDLPFILQSKLEGTLLTMVTLSPLMTVKEKDLFVQRLTQ